MLTKPPDMNTHTTPPSRCSPFFQSCESSKFRFWQGWRSQKPSTYHLHILPCVSPVHRSCIYAGRTESFSHLHAAFSRFLQNSLTSGSVTAPVVRHNSTMKATRSAKPVFTETLLTAHSSHLHSNSLGSFSSFSWSF